MNTATIDDIKALKPETESWPLRLLPMLPTIEAKLCEPGITQKMVAATLNVEPRAFSVYLSRARKLRDDAAKSQARANMRIVGKKAKQQ